MKRFSGLAVGMVIVGLTGLLLLQYGWLRSGLILEKARFDNEMTNVLEALTTRLESRTDLHDAIAVAYHPSPGNTILAQPIALMDTLQVWKRELLKQHQLDVSLALAIGTDPASPPLLFTADYDAGLQTTALAYRQVLQSDALINTCHCQVSLWAHPLRTLNLLLGRLSHYLLLGGVSLLLMLAGFGLLLYNMGQLRRLYRAHTDFTNHLAHELRTPLFTGRLLLRLLDKQTSAEGREKLAKLRTQNQRMQEQVERVLALTNLQRIAYQLKTRWTDPQDCFQSLQARFALTLQQRRAVLEIIDEIGDCRIFVDPTHWQSVLDNLLDNALKYQADPPGLIVGQRLRNGHYELWVSDRGPGIPPRERRRIFRRYYRLQQNGGQQASGYGLGLYYVRRIVRAHGGRVGMENLAGGGSRFYIRLPAASVKISEKASRTDLVKF